MKETNLKLINERIRNSEDGTVYVAADFADISEKTSVNAYLAMLANDGVIRRIMRGVYDKPVYDQRQQTFVAPAPEKVADALARNFGWTIVPSGDAALKLLGLSTQVPEMWVYVSDGTYKEYIFDNITIQFKHTSNKEISKLSYKTALIVQALKALKKDNINNLIVDQLKIGLTDGEKKAMLIEAKTATSWVYEDIKQICK